MQTNQRKKIGVLWMLLGLLTGCSVSIGPVSSSFPSSTPSNSNSSLDSSSFSSSSFSVEEEIIPLSTLIENKEDKLKVRTKGTITRILHQETSWVWLQDIVENKSYFTVIQDTLTEYAVGNEISFQGNFHYDIENETSYLDNIAQIQLLKAYEENASLPLTIEEEQYLSFSKKDVSSFIYIQNLTFSKIEENDCLFIFPSGNHELHVQFENNQDEIYASLEENRGKKENIHLTGIVAYSEERGAYLRVVNANDIEIIPVKDEVPAERNIDLYALNDFHGAVEENGYEAGIRKVGTFFKQMGEKENSLILNSGDLWQGSIESNYNRGALLTDVMNEAHFASFTLGNHEFDWEQEYIVKNSLRKGEDNYQTPFLAANIYNFDIENKQVLDYAGLGKKYVTYTLENGLKVGIIGVIGKDQITSITSLYVEDLTFVEPSNVIKELSDELRTEKNVDVVVVDIHGAQDALLNTGITSVSPVSEKRYVDAVFCAHSHQQESASENGVAFVQGGCNGKAYSQIQLTVNQDGEVETKEYAYRYTSSIQVSSYDSKIVSLVESYEKEMTLAASEELGKLDATLGYAAYEDTSVMNLVTHAMADAAQEQHYDIDYALVNQGRANLEAGTLTYGDLYKTLPFDNVVYILQVSGSVLKKELNYKSIGFYRVDKASLSTSKTYVVAVIDYLAFHRNTSRNYDYFAGFTVLGKLEKTGYEKYNYRDITREYILKLNGKISANDYAFSNIYHDRSQLNFTLN